ncbi:MAG: succinate dehydrogenase iron-sulfur subunit [Actinomycetota bacterium]
MKVQLKVFRFDPSIDQEPYWGEYNAEISPDGRVLDALHFIKWQLDGSLAFRRSCAHGVCGSDAMTINGVNRLACKSACRDLGEPIKVEPLGGFKVEKDLIVDMDSFFEGYKAVKPWMIDDEPAPDKEHVQTPAQRERFDDTTKCIMCGACTSSCPIFKADDAYLGPAAIVAAHRFIYDSRDSGASERLQVLSSAEGAFRCRTTFNCTGACPRGIKVTDAIQQVKRSILFRKPS